MKPSPAPASHDKPLTNRQDEIFRLVVSGHTDKQIAALLGISEETVAHHFRAMFGRFKVHCRAALVAQVVAQGLDRGCLRESMAEAG